LANRAAICIGVNRVGTLPPLQAAVKGALAFEAWAKAQGCDTTLLVDDGELKISVAQIFDAIEQRVDARTYGQLIVYFSGHGILQAPGVEFWLLSRAPDNANEAVNLIRSIESARNSGIPHVVFVSDACRSSVTGPPLSGVIGGSVFPNRAFGPGEAEVDVLYATRPGDPAWEVPIDKATKEYSGVFTESLLATVNAPQEALVEQIEVGAQSVPVVTSRKLKRHLEVTVPIDAAKFDIRIRQTPRVRVETALPQFFGTVDPVNVQHSRKALPKVSKALPTLDTALAALGVGPGVELKKEFAAAERLGFAAEVNDILDRDVGEHAEARFGFTIHGAYPVDAAAKGWSLGEPLADYRLENTWHLRSLPKEGEASTSLALTLKSASGRITGTLLAAIPEFLCTLVVDDFGRLTSVNYTPANNSPRYHAYSTQAYEIERRKASAEIAARHGLFADEEQQAATFLEFFQKGVNIDLILSIFAAYTYAQNGQYSKIVDLYRSILDRQPELPVIFDVAMLAFDDRHRYWPPAYSYCVPFVPMFSRGWALLGDRDPLFKGIHAELRSHLIPALWTTFDESGANAASNFVRKGEFR
jgi:Caspase domain